jgi:hypothetical protein
MMQLPGENLGRKSDFRVERHLCAVTAPYSLLGSSDLPRGFS